MVLTAWETAMKDWPHLIPEPDFTIAEQARRIMMNRVLPHKFSELRELIVPMPEGIGLLGIPHQAEELVATLSTVSTLLIPEVCLIEMCLILYHAGECHPNEPNEHRTYNRLFHRNELTLTWLTSTWPPS